MCIRDRNGGVPDDSKQIVEANNGKVWTAITDQNGKFKIGDFFEVDQRTGFINFSAGSYAFDVVTDITPQLGGQLDALTNKIVNLGTPTAAADAATKGYVDGLSFANYSDTTANFTGTLQNGGSDVVVDSDIGVTVQAYDADTAKYDDTTANFTGILQNAGSNVVVDTDIGTSVQAYDADTAKLDVAQTFTADQTFTSTQTYPRIPINSQTAAYTLVASDAGKHINITTGGVTVPSGIFSIGDAVSIYNNSSSDQTITEDSGVTLRQAGTANTGNRTLAQYGVATLLCVASDEFVISGGGLS